MTVDSEVTLACVAVSDIIVVDTGPSVVDPVSLASTGVVDISETEEDSGDEVDDSIVEPDTISDVDSKEVSTVDDAGADVDDSLFIVVSLVSFSGTVVEEIILVVVSVPLVSGIVVPLVLDKSVEDI